MGRSLVYCIVEMASGSRMSSVFCVFWDDLESDLLIAEAKESAKTLMNRMAPCEDP